MAEDGEQRLVGYCADCDHWRIRRVNFCQLIGGFIPDYVGNGECQQWAERNEGTVLEIDTRSPHLDGKRTNLLETRRDWHEKANRFTNET